MSSPTKTAPSSQRDTVPFDARVGQLLRGKWRLDRLLGVGGTSRVYAATHRNGRRGAVKLLNPDLRYLLEVRERFFRECLVASRIRHPSVVGIIDDDVTEDGTPFLVMELLDGETMGATLRRERRLDAERVIEIGGLLLDALEVVHEAGVVHADIKPENLFWTADGALKLLDFGIAVAGFEEDGQRHRREGVTMGTPGYMPPEQARGDWSKVGPRSDLWSTGATLFRLLTGAHVHAAETPGGLLRMTLLMPTLPVMARMPDAPAPLAAVLDKALSEDPEHRYESAREMRRALSLARDLVREGTTPPLDRCFETTLRSGSPALLAARLPARPSPGRRVLASFGRRSLSFAAPLFVGIVVGAAGVSQVSPAPRQAEMRDRFEPSAAGTRPPVSRASVAACIEEPPPSVAPFLEVVETRAPDQSEAMSSLGSATENAMAVCEPVRPR